MQTLGDKGGKGFWKGLFWDFIYQHSGDFLNGSRLQSCLFHLLRGDVIRLHAHGFDLHLAHFFDLRVRKLVSSIIESGLSKHQIFVV